MFTIEEGSAIYYRLCNTSDQTASGVKVAASVGAVLPDSEHSPETKLTLGPKTETLLVLSKPAFHVQAIEVTWDHGSELVAVPRPSRGSAGSIV